MAFTVTISKSTVGLESIYSQSNTYIAGAKHAISEVVPSGTTNQLVTFNFNVSSGNSTKFGLSSMDSNSILSKSSSDSVSFWDINLIDSNSFLFIMFLTRDCSVPASAHED